MADIFKTQQTTPKQLGWINTARDKRKNIEFLGELSLVNCDYNRFNSIPFCSEFTFRVFTCSRFLCRSSESSRFWRSLSPRSPVWSFPRGSAEASREKGTRERSTSRRQPPRPHLQPEILFPTTASPRPGLMKSVSHDLRNDFLDYQPSCPERHESLLLVPFCVSSSHCRALCHFGRRRQGSQPRLDTTTG